MVFFAILIVFLVFIFNQVLIIIFTLNAFATGEPASEGKQEDGQSIQGNLNVSYYTLCIKYRQEFLDTQY